VTSTNGLPRDAGAEGSSLPEGRPLRILVVDDHDVVHWGFRLMLGNQPWVERCLSARSGQEAYALAERYEPHVAIVDLFIGDESGPDICAQLRERFPAIRVLLISGAGRISASAASAAGASGFIPKEWPATDVARAVRMVGLGMDVFQPQVANAATSLSGRERAVLDLIAGGATNREIAAELHLSPHTVKDHTSVLYRKLKARNRAEAVQRAQRLGLLV
jgi:two-component system response regulator DesR